MSGASAGASLPGAGPSFSICDLISASCGRSASAAAVVASRTCSTLARKSARSPSISERCWSAFSTSARDAAALLRVAATLPGNAGTLPSGCFAGPAVEPACAGGCGVCATATGAPAAAARISQSRRVANDLVDMTDRPVLSGNERTWAGDDPGSFVNGLAEAARLAGKNGRLRLVALGADDAAILRRGNPGLDHDVHGTAGHDQVLHVVAPNK